MYNLIKMDIYRLMHSVSTLVMVLVIAAFAIFSINMTKVDVDAMKEQASVEMEQETENDVLEVSVGIAVSSDPGWATGQIESADLIAEQLKSGLLMLFVSIFTSIFVAAEQKNGYIKNIAGQLTNKGILVCSKLVAVAVQLFLIFAVYTIAAIITGTVIFGNQFEIGSLLELGKVLGIQYLLHLGFASLVLFICIGGRSSVAGMTMGIAISCGIPGLIYTSANYLIHKITKAEIAVEKYMIDTNIQNTGSGAAQEVLQRSLCVGVAFIIISVIVAMVIMQKRDIK